jgi:hypothetical protein
MEMMLYNSEEILRDVYLSTPEYTAPFIHPGPMVINTAPDYGDYWRSYGEITS